MLARIMAETGFKQLFRKVHQLCRMYPDMTTTIKLRGKWVDVDPSEWQERTNMSVNVGLGFNNKQQMTMLLTQLLAMQKEALPTGLADLANIYNTLEKLVESAGVGAVEQFFKDPSAPGFEAPEPPPDPNMILAQAQAGALQQEQQRKMFEAQQKGQIDGQKAQADGTKYMLDAQAKAAETALKQREIEFKERELQLKERELSVREAEALAGIDNTASDTDLKEAQRVKTLADAGRAAADTQRAQLETSDEMREARDILENSIDETAEPETDAEDDDSAESE